MSMRTRLVISALLCPAFLAQAGESPAEAPGSSTKVFALSETAGLVMEAPSAWRSEVTREGDKGLLTFEFSPAEGDSFFVQISPVVLAQVGGETRRLEGLRALVEKEASELGPGAVEKNLVVRNVPGAAASGFWFTATDAAPKPGEYEYMTRAWLDKGEYSLSVTVLTHAKDAPEIETALRMVGSSTIRVDKEAGPVASATGGRQELRLPGRDWALVFEIPGYHETDRDKRADGSGVMMMANNDATHMIVSIFIEAEDKASTSKECRDKYWKKVRKSPVPKTKIGTSETATMALGEYTISSPDLPGFSQRHVNAYMGVGDACVDIHLSRVNFTNDHEPLFSAVLDSVEIRRD